ncbi:signal peptide peptidase SppA [Methanolobus mangrovi]|uniref:Signal peptide peptidase SppA n=1 Tax=Methanolobus mangrovi TaxID=3072977 RepID=A0AA51UEC5_9EURY|nr:signal peptide peptidase SppA [Methanolobus mangrovi]WMW21645.1 signal peptide peptidase SppA [Methanolobus mangrovi]
MFTYILYPGWKQEMNGDNSDKKTDDDIGYHRYPYSYGEAGNDNVHSSVESNNAEPEVTEPEQTSVTIETAETTAEAENYPTMADNITDDDPVDEVPVEEKEEKTEYKQEKTINATTTYAEPSQEPPVTKKKSRKWQYIAIVAVLLFIIGVSFAVIYQTFNGDLYSSNDKVAVIYVQGTLITSSIPGGLGYVSSEEVSDNIRKALRDEDVKAIVLRVNSGGGSSTAGEEIYTEVKKASDSGVPVIISMGDVAASAAYHLSAPADLIIANPSTMTGSIGTIWTFQNLSAYYSDEGVEFYIVKSGEFKDMGGAWRGLSDDEKEYANKVVAEVYGNFVRDVAEGRDMSTSEVKALADGRIYTGREAKELGLVDEFGNLYDSIDRAAEIGGIKGEPTIVYMNKPSLSSLLFGSESEATVSSEEFLRYYEESPYGQIS